MYSGTTLTRYSGRIMGAHQKFDRVSRRQLKKLLGSRGHFPLISKILHFEGKNGPDAIKRKSPAYDEPWHYFNPFDETDTQLIELIQDHYDKLVEDLRTNNNERAAFEAAWLAHAIVDGLTPAHHYPYEEKLVEIRGGDDISTRTSLKAKLVMPGNTRREQVMKNWQMWGPKGLMTSHGMFELGVASLIKPLTFSESLPKKKELKLIGDIGVAAYFVRAAREIAVLDMYHIYLDKGFTARLAYQVRHKLGPIIVKSITLAWYQAVLDASAQEPKAKS